MLRGLPKNVEDELFEHCKDSYERGIEVRRTGIRQSALILIAMVVVCTLLQNVAAGLVVAVAVSVSSLCIIWAVYSVSASLNLQSDMITRLLVHSGLEQSLSRKANPYDNAHMESFFGSLKAEMVHHERFRNVAHAIAQVSDYIYFYNYERYHSALGYRSPVQYEKLAA